MIERAVHPEPPSSPSADHQLALDERSMRALEVSLALLALIAALLLTAAR